MAKRKTIKKTTSKRSAPKKTSNKKPAAKRTTGKKATPKKAQKKNESKKFLGLIPVRIKKHRDREGGHHHIIFEDLGNKHVSVGLTTKPTKGKNSTHTNYKCEVNPLGGKETSYLRRQGTVDRKGAYSKEEEKGQMHPKDYQAAKGYADKAKENHLKKAKKK